MTGCDQTAGGSQVKESAIRFYFNPVKSSILLCLIHRTYDHNSRLMVAVFHGDLADHKHVPCVHRGTGRR